MTAISAELPTQRVNSLTRLREAARRLFVQQGYHATRPQDIARAAGVANGTFYLHFSDKQQAFLDFSEQAQQELLADLAGRFVGEDRRTRWQNLCRAIIDFGVQHPGLLQAAFIDPVFIAPESETAWESYDRLGNLMAQVLRREGVNDEYDVEILSHGICGLLRHAMMYAGRSELDSEQLARDLGGFIDRGLN